MKITELDQDLQLIVQENAKVYLVKETRIGTITKIKEDLVEVNIGTKKSPENIRFSTSEFCYKLSVEDIVAKSRVQYNERGNYTGLKPRTGVSKHSKVETKVITPVLKTPPLNSTTELIQGFINEKTGKFSKTQKRGYTEIKYSVVKTRVTLDLNDEQIEKLKEMGVL